jgi:hypothetical protein
MTNYFYAWWMFTNKLYFKAMDKAITSNFQKNFNFFALTIEIEVLWVLQMNHCSIVLELIMESTTCWSQQLTKCRQTCSSSNSIQSHYYSLSCKGPEKSSVIIRIFIQERMNDKAVLSNVDGKVTMVVSGNRIIFRTIDQIT